MCDRQRSYACVWLYQLQYACCLWNTLALPELISSSRIVVVVVVGAGAGATEFSNVAARPPQNNASLRFFKERG